ncbi:MAG: DNA polymerase III subunit delta [Oscillospiraceae bacterium]|nr:DNA polymerase III subunit delta [Oscillospiraceae bacterium]
MAKQKPTNQGYKTFREEFKAETLRSLYLFWGEEDYLREFYLGKLQELLLPEGLAEFNYFRLDGKGTDIAAISEAVEALPVFSPKKLVEVRDFDFYKGTADQRDALDELFTDLPDYCVLVFVFTDPGFRPDGRMKIHRHFAKGAGLSVEFGKQDQSDLTLWLRRRFSALNKEIDRPTAEYLMFRSGGLMTGLLGEIEKIAAYAKGPAITKEDINAVGTPVLDAVVWQLTDALGQRDMARATKVMGELLLMRESPIMLLAVTGRQLRQLLSAKLVAEAGQDAAYLKKLWGIHHDYPARLLMEAARRADLVWCKEAVLLAARTDLQMKSTGRDGEELLKEFLIQLAAGSVA